MLHRYAVRLIQGNAGSFASGLICAQTPRVAPPTLRGSPRVYTTTAFSRRRFCAGLRRPPRHTRGVFSACGGDVGSSSPDLAGGGMSSAPPCVGRSLRPEYSQSPGRPGRVAVRVDRVHGSGFLLGGKRDRVSARSVLHHEGDRQRSEAPPSVQCHGSRYTRSGQLWPAPQKHLCAVRQNFHGGRRDDPL